MDNAIATIDFVNTIAVLFVLALLVIAWLVAFRHGKDEGRDEYADRLSSEAHKRHVAEMHLEAARMANRKLQMKAAIASSPRNVRA